MSIYNLIGMSSDGQYYIGAFDLTPESETTSLSTRVSTLESGWGTMGGDITSLTSRVTAIEAAYVPKTLTINGKPLSSNIVLAYSDLTGLPTIPSVLRTSSALSLSLVGTGATGTQISSTKDSTVRTTVSTSATATIAGAAVSSVALKICATNDSVEGNWTQVAVSETSQSYSLAVALQGVTAGKGVLIADLPAGWYCKLVNTGSGTHSESFISGQKTIYG